MGRPGPCNPPTGHQRSAHAGRRSSGWGAVGGGAARVAPPPASQVEAAKAPECLPSPQETEQYVGGPWTLGGPSAAFWPSRLRPGTQAPLGPPTGT